MAGRGLNLEIQVDFPGGSGLVRAYQEGDPGAVAFYGRHFASREAYAEKAAEVDARFDREGREGAARAIRVPEGGDEDRLRRFVEEGGWLVTTGQQPGLFGGPLYSLYKGLTAIRLAEALEASLGKPVLPLFWVASEDHDWPEANHTALVGVDNELHRVEIEAPDPSVAPPLHRIVLDGRLEDAAEEILAHLPETDFSRPYFTLLREAAREGGTLPTSFHEVLEALLGPRGLFFTDAADPVVKERSRSLLLRELEHAEAHERILAETGAELEAAGHALQVTLMEGGVNLFLEGPAGRERLYREDGGFRLRTSGEHLEADEIRARVEADPSILSPNVLLRPVAESAVFPTLAYVAGPGETAYFAQLGAYFGAFGIEMPVIHPRLGATIVESKIRKVLDKFGMEPGDLARPFHEIAGEIAREEVPDHVQRALGELRGSVARGVGALQKEVQSIDPTLKGPVQHVRSQAFAAIDDAEKKIVHALKRENEIALSQLEKAQLHLFPGGKPQERVVNAVYYLARYGEAFLDLLHDRFEVNPD